MGLSCLEFRQRVGAAPQQRSAAILAHQLECPQCAEFAREQSALDRRLEAALRIPVPAELPARAVWRQSALQRRPGRWLALAASLLLATGLGFGVMQLDRFQPLPTAVAAHIDHEPELLMPPYGRAEAIRVSAVLQRGGASLSAPLTNVVHAGLCPFRGRMVPHLVIEMDGEPVSVLLLANERLAKPQAVNEQGYRGVLVPHQQGSIAILGPREDLLIPVREQLERNLNWTI